MVSILSRDTSSPHSAQSMRPPSGMYIASQHSMMCSSIFPELGFGGAFTEAAGYNYSLMPDELKKAWPAARKFIGKNVALPLSLFFSISIAFLSTILLTLFKNFRTVMFFFHESILKFRSLKKLSLLIR